MPTPHIPPEFDARHLVKAGYDKQRGRHVGAFESLKHAKKELRHPFRLLCENPPERRH